MRKRQRERHGESSAEIHSQVSQLWQASPCMLQEMSNVACARHLIRQDMSTEAGRRGWKGCAKRYSKRNAWSILHALSISLDK